MIEVCIKMLEIYFVRNFIEQVMITQIVFKIQKKQINKLYG